MESKIFSTQFLYSQIKALDVGIILCIFGMAFFIYVVFAVLRLTLWRTKYSQLFPGHKFFQFNIFGNLLDLTLSESSRNRLPFSVNFLQVISGFAEIFRKEKLFCFWIAYFPFVILIKAEAVEALLNGTKMIEKNRSYKFLRPWLGTGLLTSRGAKWRPRRKLLTPSFHFEILKDFLPVFNEQSNVLVQKLQEETKKAFTDIMEPVTLCSLDIICETILGVSIRAQENCDSDYVKSVSKISEIIMKREINPFLWPDLFFSLTQKGKEFKQHLEVLHGFTRSVIQEKKNKLLCGNKDFSNGRKRKAFLDLLLEHHIEKNTLTEEDVREEVDTFTLGGHDTTAVGMSWALYLIGLHKGVQATIHEELDSIFGNDVEREVTADDLNEMKYLDCVLKESIRLYPSVPLFARHITEDFVICGYTIPKGFSCFVIPYILHRDKDVFPKPEEFIPDRFSKENSVNRHPYAFVPFSAGPRNCIGQRFAIMEEKVIVSSVLRNYTLDSLDEIDKILPVPELTLKPSTPFRIKIRPRHVNKL